MSFLKSWGTQLSLLLYWHLCLECSLRRAHEVSWVAQHNVHLTLTKALSLTKQRPKDEQQRNHIPVCLYETCNLGQVTYCLKASIYLPVQWRQLRRMMTTETSSCVPRVWFPMQVAGLWVTNIRMWSTLTSLAISREALAATMGMASLLKS